MTTLENVDKTARVLIVEDDPFIATGLEEMILDLGFHNVDVCLTFERAQAAVERGGFGLAIFDVNVGGMLSFGLISKVLAQSCPVVTISGYVVETNPTERRVFLAKPVDIARLETAIAKAHDVLHGAPAQ